MESSSLRARVRWLTRSLDWTHNPLRRLVDRVTACWVLALLAAALMAVPVGAAFGSAAYEQGLREAAAAASTRHQAIAIVVTEPRMRSVGNGPHQTTEVWADLRWTGADGRPRTAPAEVRSSSVVGSSLPIWVDQAGHKTVAPRTEGQVRVSAVLYGVAIMATLQTLCGALIVGVHAITTCWTRRAWEREWEIVEPKWARQRH